MLRRLSLLASLVLLFTRGAIADKKEDMLAPLNLDAQSVVVLVSLRTLACPRRSRLPTEPPRTM